MNEETLLVKACADGNPVAQQQLFDRYSKKMMGVCLRYAEDRMEAQDILQEGFIKVFDAIKSFSHTGSLEGWVRRIIVNTALDNYRRTKAKRHAVNIDDVEYTLKEEAGVVEHYSAQHLMDMIHQMPEGYRVIFNLYAIEGYSHKEIAKQMGISESTSKSQYSRARAYLQKALEKEDK